MTPLHHSNRESSPGPAWVTVSYHVSLRPPSGGIVQRVVTSGVADSRAHTIEGARVDPAHTSMCPSDHDHTGRGGRDPSMGTFLMQGRAGRACEAARPCPEGGNRSTAPRARRALAHALDVRQGWTYRGRGKARLVSQSLVADSSAHQAGEIPTGPAVPTPPQERHTAARASSERRA